MGRKLGAVPLLGELSPHLTQCGLGRGLPPRQVSSWSIQSFGHNTPTSQTGQRETGQWSDSTGQSVLQTVAQPSWSASILAIQLKGRLCSLALSSDPIFPHIQSACVYACVHANVKYVRVKCALIQMTDPRWNKSILKNLKSSTWNSSTACSSDITALHALETAKHIHAIIWLTHSLTKDASQGDIFLWENF